MTFERGNISSQIVLLIFPLLYWPLFALSVKRFHDMGLSGYLSLFKFTGIGWVYVIIVNGSREGTGSYNKYGKDPLSE